MTPDVGVHLATPPCSHTGGPVDAHCCADVREPQHRVNTVGYALEDGCGTVAHDELPPLVHVAHATQDAVPTVARLITAGAHVAVYGGDVPPILEDLAEQGIVTWHRHDYAPTPGDAALWGGGTAPAEVVHQWHAVGARDVAVWAQRLARPSFVGLTRAVQVEPGQVWLVGAGPGRPELVTVGCLAAVQQADVVVADRLVSVELLAAVAPGTEVVDVAKLPRGRHTSQGAIHDVLVDRAQAGRRVVRLKGGDPFLFGRGGEEVLACQDAGVPVRWLPGVTSAVAVPAAAGVPVTHRGLSQGVTVVSGHVPPGHAASTVDWGAVAQTGTTVVVLMGVANIGAICTALQGSGVAPDTPVVVASDRGLGQASSRHTTVGALAGGEPVGLTAPAVCVIGPAAEALGG